MADSIKGKPAKVIVDDVTFDPLSHHVNCPCMMEPMKFDAMLDAIRAEQAKCDALIDAGWRFELPEIVNRKEFWVPIKMPGTDPWQWYWRAPARPGLKGKRFLSTQQAFNALTKSRAASGD